MKTTSYFLYMRTRADRAMIKDEWITEVIGNPIETVIQGDGRIKKWGFVREEGRYLRVILLEDGETVHNAFFDRGFAGKST